jgi:choline dehydrogenase-like flavoprotein
MMGFGCNALAVHLLYRFFRLSEDPNVVVGVIEAGPYGGSLPEIDIPGMSGKTVGNPKFDWSFSTVQQKSVDNRIIREPRGKGLGGSSLVRLSDCHTRLYA